ARSPDAPRTTMTVLSFSSRVLSRSRSASARIPGWTPPGTGTEACHGPSPSGSPASLRALDDLEIARMERDDGETPHSPSFALHMRRDGVDHGADRSPCGEIDIVGRGGEAPEELLEMKRKMESADGRGGWESGDRRRGAGIGALEGIEGLVR